MDSLTKAHRSQLMSRIRSKDTGPEMLVRKALWKTGIRYRLHPKNIPGTPDLWFPRLQTALFIHGCFWHGHEQCALYRLPKTRPDMWLAKVERNKARDERVQIRLMANGTRIILLWECALRKAPAKTIHAVMDFLSQEQAPASLLEVRESRSSVVSTLLRGRWE